jgi:fibronectin type 3 domain-containing protein
MTYYYKVRAYNNSGGGSDQSYYASATTSGSVLATPTNVTAVAQSSSSIYVSWYQVSGASGYRVYRADSSGYYSPLPDTSNASYMDTGLSSNTTYSYKVIAYNNSGGASPQSNPVSATTLIGVPTSVTATAQSSTSIGVSWGSVSGASGYHIYRATSSSGSYSNIVSVYGVSYTDTGLSPNTTYYYKISAYSNTGESEQSYYTYTTTYVSVPTGLTAVAQSPSSISVSWDPVNEASYYRVYRATSSGGYYSNITSTSGTSFDDTGLSSNTTYYYKVSAYGNAGESALSSYTSAITPPTPGILNITVGFNLGAIVITGSNGANTIRQTTGAPSSLELSAEGYTGVVWYVDGNTSAPVSGNTLTINALEYTTKLHSVTFTGYKNGTPYAQAIPFTVLY